jgi:hypothetical protein
MQRRLLALLAFLILGQRAFAADSVVGTFTVNGRTLQFKNVYASLERDAAVRDRQYLMLLVSDVPVAAADRTPARLLELAKGGRIHALRIRWVYGTDTLAVSPYHQAIAESGQAFSRFTTLDLKKFDDNKIDAEFKSKMLGQTWFFNAAVKADVAQGAVAMLEPEAEPTATATREPGDSDATALKRQLGSMGYAFTTDAFFQAIGDRDPKAVELFLQAGMSANAASGQSHSPLHHAVLMCGADAAKAGAVIQALIRGKADAKSKDSQTGMPTLIAALQTCPADAIEAIVKGGADLSAKAPSGLTALQLADIFQRSDVAAMLRKNGAK